MANAAGAFYTNLMPEADAWKLTERPMSELRQNGGYAAMAAIYAQSSTPSSLPDWSTTTVHLYVNKAICHAGPDGPKLRITPVYRDFFRRWANRGADRPGEVYTALERGVVDGYAGRSAAIFDLGWHEKTKYRRRPRFYTAKFRAPSTRIRGTGSMRRRRMFRASLPSAAKRRGCGNLRGE